METHFLIVIVILKSMTRYSGDWVQKIQEDRSLKKLKREKKRKTTVDSG